MTLFSCASKSEEKNLYEEYGKDLLGTQEVDISSVSKSFEPTNICMTYVEASESTNNMLRFATPILIGRDLNYISFVREMNGEEKEFKITSLYKTFKGNNKTYYFDNEKGLVTEDPGNNYYFACFTIQFNDTKCESKNIKGYLKGSNGAVSPWIFSSYVKSEYLNKYTVTYTSENEILGREIVKENNKCEYIESLKYEEEGDSYSYDIYNGEVKFDTSSNINKDLALTLKKDPYIHFHKVSGSSNDSFVVYYTAWDGAKKVNVNNGVNFTSETEGFSIIETNSSRPVFYIEVNTTEGFLKFVFKEDYKNGESYYLMNDTIFKLSNTSSYKFTNSYKFSKTDGGWEYKNTDNVYLFEIKEIITSSTNKIYVSVNFNGNCTDFNANSPWVVWKESGDVSLRYGSLKGDDNDKYLEINFSTSAVDGNKYKLLNGLSITTNDGVIHTLKSDVSFIYYLDIWHISSEGHDFLYDLDTQKIISSSYNKISIKIDAIFTNQNLSISNGFKYNNEGYNFKSVKYNDGLVTFVLNSDAIDLDLITIDQGSYITDGINKLIFIEDESISYYRLGRKWIFSDEINDDYGKEFIVFADLPGNQNDLNVIDMYKDLNMNTMLMTNDSCGCYDTTNKCLIYDDTNNYKKCLDTLSNNDMNIFIRNYENYNSFFDKVGSDLAEHANITGYYMADEPFANNSLATKWNQPGVAFDQYSKLINWKNTYASNELFYMNMVPSSSYNHWDSNERDDYGNFLDTYINQMVNPLRGHGKANIGLDHYPLLNSNCIDEYYLWDLLTAANKVRDYNKTRNNENVEAAFSLCIQSSKSASELRSPSTVEEISFQVNLGIALGSRIFEYFTFESNSDYGISDGIVNKSGNTYTKGTSYEFVKKVNNDYIYLGPILNDFTWKGLIKGTSAIHSVNSINEFSLCDSLFINCSSTESLVETYSTDKEFVIGSFINSANEEGFYVTNYSDPLNEQEDNTSILLRFQNENYSGHTKPYNFTKAKVYSAGGQSMVVSLNDGLFNYNLKKGEGIFVVPLQ